MYPQLEPTVLKWKKVFYTTTAIDDDSLCTPNSIMETSVSFHFSTLTHKMPPLDIFISHSPIILIWNTLSLQQFLAALVHLFCSLSFVIHGYTILIGIHRCFILTIFPHLIIPLLSHISIFYLFSLHCIGYPSLPHLFWSKLDLGKLRFHIQT